VIEQGLNVSKKLSSANNLVSLNSGQSVHHDFISNAIPDWLVQSGSRRVGELKQSPKVIPSWLEEASSVELLALNLASVSRSNAQAAVDRMFERLQDVYAFAQPLLVKALKDQYGVSVDVRETFVRLYSPAHLSPWVMNVAGGMSVRTVSLLDAALHNFSANEVFQSGSGFISKPDEQGLFEVKVLNALTVEQFKELCRTLDIGQRYKVYLQDYLRPTDALPRHFLRSQVIESQKHTFKMAAHLALMKKDISAEVYLHALHLFGDKRGLKLDGLPVRYFHLTMLDVRLTGIVLMMPDPEAPVAGVRRVIAYVPHDPQHPLKEYPSSQAFFAELTRQLRGDTDAAPSTPNRYQVFFSQFVEHEQRGRFFAQLHAQLFPIQYHGPSPRPDQPSWRETPAPNPHLRFGAIAFGDQTGERFNADLWGYLFQQQVNKMLNDGRTLAVSTADADSAERWAWVEDFEQMFFEILNVALLVVTPFVPFLGEMMLSYMVYQLLGDVVEGVIDLAAGDYVQAVEHLLGATESIIEAGLFAVGGSFAREVIRPKLSAFLENAAPVTLADGSQRLWGQNLEPYLQRNLQLAAEARPQADGLHLHQGKSILRLDARHFEIRKDRQSGQHRIQHPGRPHAYQPVVNSNGAGAFVIEGEKPLNWDVDTLMRRLGSSVEGLSDDFAAIRTVSQVEPGALRRMYADHERAIPLLSDTVTRFRIDRDIKTFIEQLSSASPDQYLNADPVWQFQLLDGVWPGEPVELIGARGERLGYLGAVNARPLRLSLERLMDGDWLKTLVTQLDDAQIRALLGDSSSAPVSSPEVSTRRLRVELARLARRRQSRLFEQRYNREAGNISAPARVIQDQLQPLPGPVAQALASLATPAELEALAQAKIPERLLNLGRWAQQDVRISRAYEGLFLESVESAESDTLVLHSLANLPGWNPDVSIEVCLYRYGGRQLDRIGSATASIQRTIVVDEHGRFQAHDASGQALHPSSDFYTAILQALPDGERNRLGIHIGEMSKLKSALREHLLKPHRLLKVLNDLPVLPVQTFDPSFMRLRGGGVTDAAEVPVLQGIAETFSDFVAAAFHPSVAEFEQYNYLRGLQLMNETLPLECWNSLVEAFISANAQGYEANQRVVRSIEVLPDLQKLMSADAFQHLIGRLFTADGLEPLTESECNLGSIARNLQQTGRDQDYQALRQAVLENPDHQVEPWEELREYHELLSSGAEPDSTPSEVTAQVMANLQSAQRAIFRAKELLPLSGNQLPSIWEKGGSAIAKIKGLRQLDLQSGDFTARWTSAETARKAIAIKGGNCSENSKVTFSILASQPRASRIHIVKATAFDHQYVVIGDDLSNLAELVVADSWPEFPVAHTADKGYFRFELPALETLEPGPAVADYAFIESVPPGPAALPQVSQENTIRQIKINKLHQRGAYAQFTSVTELGARYHTPDEVPVSFELLPTTVIEKRIEAYRDYQKAFEKPGGAGTE
jgi:hypothetical protein